MRYAILVIGLLVGTCGSPALGDHCRQSFRSFRYHDTGLEVLPYTALPAPIVFYQFGGYSAGGHAAPPAYAPAPAAPAQPQPTYAPQPTAVSDRAALIAEVIAALEARGALQPQQAPKPITEISNTCVKCHNNNIAKKGVNFEGPIDARLAWRARKEIHAGTMPPGGKLDPGKAGRLLMEFEVEPQAESPAPAALPGPPPVPKKE